MIKSRFQFIRHFIKTMFVIVPAAVAVLMFISCENPQKPEPELLPPASVRVSLVGTEFVVTWDKAAGSGLSYEILRKVGVGEFSVISAKPVGENTYTDNDFPVDTSLVYVVRSVSGDRCSQPSKPSNQVSRFILGLKASLLEYTDRIVVTWTPYAGATGYVVYRFDNASPTPVVIGKPGACEWSDVTAKPDTPYFYQVSWMENATEKGTGGPAVPGIYSQVKDSYEPNNDYRNIESQTVSSVFSPGSPPVIYSFSASQGSIYADTDWYKYVGPAAPVTVTVTIPANNQFNDGELLFSFFYNNVQYPVIPLTHGSNINPFDSFGTATGNVSLYFRIVPAVPSSRQVMGTYNVAVTNGF